MSPASTPEPRERHRIGIFGGTFDPVHIGHLVVAVNARHALDLDEVLLVVANEPWQKVVDRPVSPAAARLAVVEAAIGQCVGIVASSIEIDRGGPSYTADTLAELRRLGPSDEFFVIVGSDVAMGMLSWERPSEIRDAATVVVVRRPGVASGSAGPRPLDGWRVVEIEVPALEISSTELRERVRTGRPLDFLVPDAAIRAIDELGLYSPQR